jgi:hypothetical protein
LAACTLLALSFYESKGGTGGYCTFSITFRVCEPLLFVVVITGLFSASNRQVELVDTLSGSDTFFVYGHCGTPPTSGGNTFILMDITTMLGYLTGFQLDTPRIFKKDLISRPLFQTILKKKTERRTFFESTVFLNKTIFTARRSTQHALCFGSITKEHFTIAL